MSNQSPVRSRKVTRADVARHAEVSTAVVSYAMNDGPKPIAAATKARVLESAKVLGYTPNAAARALRRGTADMLGLIILDNRNPFFAELTHAIELAAREEGYSLLISNVSDDGSNLTALIRSLSARQVDGVIITAPLGPREITEIMNSEIPTVLLNQFAPMKGFTTIGADFYAGTCQAVEHLIAHGHTAIDFVGGPDPIDLRFQGWADTLERHGLRRGSRLDVDFSRAGGSIAGEMIMASEARPTAVFVSSDQQAIGLLSSVQALGYRIPEDLAVVSFDGSPEGQFAWPPLTSVSQPIEHMGKLAVHAILDPTAEPRDNRFETQLLIRRSCGLNHG